MSHTRKRKVTGKLVSEIFLLGPPVLLPKGRLKGRLFKDTQGRQATASGSLLLQNTALGTEGFTLQYV